MIRGAIKSVWSLLVLGVVLYGLFFVPLGERTLFEHIWRIAHTDEAQDLGREAAQAGARAGREVARQVEEAEEESPDGGAATDGDAEAP